MNYTIIRKLMLNSVFLESDCGVGFRHISSPGKRRREDISFSYFMYLPGFCSANPSICGMDRVPERVGRNIALL
jgi:hypothetical protein